MRPRLLLYLITPWTLLLVSWTCCSSIASAATIEPLSSTVTGCNRTLFGEPGFKYPLRLTEPLQRFLPFVCEITFSATGSRAGDIIVLTFLSFQVGSLEITKDQMPTCNKGHIGLREPPTSVAIERPGSSVNSSISSGAGEGRFCGQMMASQRVAVYFSTGNNLTLNVYLPPGRAFYEHSLPFSLFLTYRILPVKNSAALMSSPDSSTDFGIKLANSHCDRIFEDCLPPRRCKIRSPNYPGFFLRNVTCRYLIRQKRVPRGYRPRITISQPNEYKISIYSGSSPGSGSSGGGSSSSMASKANQRGLQSDCQADVIRIHDGPYASSPRLAQFCGSGHLPPVVASKSAVLVTLSSVSDMVLYDSRAELDIEVSLVLIQLNETLYATANICDQAFTADKMRSGVISSPSHTIPANTSCEYSFESTMDSDRVWLYFASYYVPDLSHWNSEEKCTTSRLEIYGAAPGWTAIVELNETLTLIDGQDLEQQLSAHHPEQAAFPPHSQQPGLPVSLELQSGLNSSSGFSSSTSSSSPSLRFCEKSSPRVCGRASDSQRYLPSIPCTYPEESYLSSGPRLTIKHQHFKSNNLYSAGSAFVARFEFVDTRESGSPVEGSLCDRVFKSEDGLRGDVRSSRNVFLFGRGGRQNVTCSYKFVGTPGQRLQLNLTSFMLGSSNCRHSVDTASGMYVCRARYSGSSVTERGPQRLATLVVLDTVRSKRVSVGCFCSGEKSALEKALTFELVGSEVVVNLTVTGMQSSDDFNEFAFEAKFEFLPALLISKALGNVLLLLLLLCYCFALSVCCVRVALPSSRASAVVVTDNRTASCECVAFKPTEITATPGRPIVDNDNLHHHHHHRTADYWPNSNFYQ